MKLKGKNFQPWAEFEMDIDGLTVLVGPSNKGKSSLFRALKGVLRNEIPDEFVRNNQDEPLEIELEVDGHNIKAVRKKKGSTKYTVDGKNYTSLGGKLPDEVEKLHFGEVKIGDYTLDPIFAVQNRAQFLIDSDRWKPNELNAILGAFSSTEKLDAGKKEANTRITQRKSEASTLASEIRAAEERSATLLEITGEASVVAEAVLGLERGIRGDEAIVGQLGSTVRHRARLEPLQDVLDALTLPDLTETTRLAHTAANLELAANSFVASRFLRKVEAGLDEPVLLWKGITGIYKRNNALEDLLGIVHSRTKGSATDCSNGLAFVIRQIETQLTEAKTLSNSILYLAKAAVSVQSYENCTTAVGELDAQLEEAEAELDAVRKEVAAEAARKETASKLCPKCGKTLEHTCQ